MFISPKSRVLAVLLLVSLSACEGAAVDGGKSDDPETMMSGGDLESDRPKLRLVSAPEASQGSNVTLDVKYERGNVETGPRVAEVIVHHEGLTLKSASAGQALERADKELTTMKVDESTTRLVMLSSSNVNELSSGTLASLHFARSGGRARAEILVERPCFAPAEANEGLLVSDPIEP